MKTILAAAVGLTLMTGAAMAQTTTYPGANQTPAEIANNAPYANPVPSTAGGFARPPAGVPTASGNFTGATGPANVAVQAEPSAWGQVPPGYPPNGEGGN
jgi:hypothetical protein